MEYKRIGFIFGVLLLIWMSACGPATPTPTGTVSCVQTGCAYPAVCDKTSGQCTIYLTPQAPAAEANNLGNAGAIAANPANPGSLLPVCPPPPSAISKITSFCANPAAGQGGATVTWATSPTPAAYASYYVYEDDSQLVSGKATCDNNIPQVCSGPQDTKITIMLCSTCSSLASATEQSDLQNDPSVCPTGFSLGGGGDCENPAYAANGEAPVMPCVTGTHYDNDKQNCVDDVTGKIASPCPPGYPYLYALGFPSKCYKNPLPISNNCQPYTIYLGACTGPIKKICQPPSGGCGYGNNGLQKHWDSATCSCK